MTSSRVVIALGGNAMTGPDGSATPGAQRAAIAAAAGHIADVVARRTAVVASPEPRSVDYPAIHALAPAGFVVVCAGGGGIPVVADGPALRGVEAVIDKDLTAAVLPASSSRTRWSSPPTSRT